jgi:predicted HTH transcriptional regulator
MTEQEILSLRDHGEVTKVQFKERILDAYDMGCEMVAFSNTHGGQLVIGINDKTGKINAMSFQEVQETTSLLGNIASENVIPSILLNIETVAVEGGHLVVASIKEGLNKPYHDNKGIVWMKNGADKRRVIDNAELAEMMSQCGTFAPDEVAVPNATINDLNEQCLKTYLLNRFAVAMAQKGVNEQNMRDYTLEQMTHFIAGGVSMEVLMRNLHFMRPDGKLTVAAMLLFGKHPQRWLPAYTAKCISYVGNYVGGIQFRDKVNDSDMEGNLLHQYETIMAFFTRNLRNVQVSKDFNSQGKLEISYAALIEFVVNALVHRSLNWKAPIRVFIFDNRVEIHSPGELPNGLTVDDIVKGTSMPRNQFLFTNANFLLPYTGAGSGILRALEEGLDVTFKNEERIHEFVTIIKRAPEANAQEGNQGSVQESVQGSVQESAQESAQERCLKPSLTKSQKDIVNFCSVPRTSQEILYRLGLSNHSANRKRHIQALVDMGILEMTIPEKPNDRNQKYRKKKK